MSYGYNKPHELLDVSWIHYFSVWTYFSFIFLSVVIVALQTEIMPGKRTKKRKIPIKNIHIKYIPT